MTTDTITPGSILVGYAGAQDDDHAVKWAAEQAVLENRTLTIVHAVRPVTGYEFGAMAGGYYVPDDLPAAALADGRDTVDEAVRSVLEKHPGLEVEGFVSEGSPDKALLDHASEAAAIVVGSRGRGRVASVLLGSVGVTVARRATCPVVVVRPHHPGKVRNGILVGTDCTENTRSTLLYAYREASLRRLPLTVLHAVPDLHLGTGRDGDEGPEVSRCRLRLAETVAGMQEEFPDVRVRTCLGAGDPAKLLAEQSDAMDLVVVGHHRSAVVGDPFGSGSYAPTVIERARCPVAVVFDAPADHLV